MQITKKFFLAAFILLSTPSYLRTEPISIIIAIAAGITALCQTYSTVDHICEKVSPDPQRKLNNLIAKERIEYVKAKNAFKKCLESTNSATKRNAKNIPTDCQKLASAFIKCGGKNEITEMIQNFDHSQE